MAGTWDIAQGNWKQFKGVIKEKFGELTDDELDVIDGKQDQLIGKLQKQYGYTKDDAERQVNDLLRDFSKTEPGATSASVRN